MAASPQPSPDAEEADYLALLGDIDRGPAAGAAVARPGARQPREVGRAADGAALVLLVAFVLLYQVQSVAPWIADLRVREGLYAWLYLRLVLFHLPARRVALTPPLALVGLFLAYCLFLAVYTHLLHGPTLATEGFARFVNVALLAPLAAAYLGDHRRLGRVLRLWLGVVAAGALTAIYQFLGGDLQWLLREYVSRRVAVDRYKTLLGEPNVGGMASVVTLLWVVVMPGPWPVRAVLAALAAALLLLSVSKAALAGLAFAALILWLHRHHHRRDTRFLRRLLLLSALTATIAAAAALTRPDLADRAGTYARAFYRAFVGVEHAPGHRFGVVEDLVDRVYHRPASALDRARAQSDFFALNLVAGSGYGIAGSVAIDQLGADLAILPHNGYVETLLVGGLVLLALLAALVAVTLVRLRRRSAADPDQHFLFLAFALLALYLVSYPVIYEPVLGALFWLAVGVGAGSRLDPDARFSRWR